MNLKQHKPLIFALGAGALGFCLRLALYRTGFDERNILSSSHPLHVACLVLTVLAAVYLAAAVHRRQAAGTPVELFPDSPLRSIAALAAACLMTAAGCVVGALVLEATDLYEKNVDEVYAEETANQRRNFAVNLAHRYASLELGKLPQRYWEENYGSLWLYNTYVDGRWFYDNVSGCPLDVDFPDIGRIQRKRAGGQIPEMFV